MSAAHDTGTPPPGRRPLRGWLVLGMRLLLVLITAALVWFLLHLL